MAREAWSALLVAVLALAEARPASAIESQGGLRLLGTVVSSNAARSLAMVDQGGAQRVVRVGGELGGATVVEIRSDSVVLRRAGQTETLALQAVARRPVTPPSSAPASPAPGDGDDAAGAPGSADSARKPHGARGPAAARGGSARAASGRAKAPASAPSEAQTARSNDELLADLAGQARFAPVLDDSGKLRGVALMNVASDSTLEQLGLRSDDVVTAIQGVKVDSSGAAMNVARGLSPSQPVRLDLERRGVPTVVMIDPASLQRP